MELSQQGITQRDIDEEVGCDWWVPRSPVKLGPAGQKNSFSPWTHGYDALDYTSGPEHK